MVKEVVLIHVPFSLGYRVSGGGIRPQKMATAFEKSGLEVIIIEGDHKKRASALENICRKISDGKLKIKFIYSESSASPSLLSDKKNIFSFRDYHYLKKLKKMGIPILLFYRDIHWNFTIAGKDYPFLRWLILKALHYYDIFEYLKIVDVLFLPSLKMKPFIPLNQNFKIVDELPPGHDIEELQPQREIKGHVKGIYVGGVLPPVYDISQLFKMDTNLDITVCCRKDEWNSISTHYGKIPERMQIVHLSGDELMSCLKKSHVSLIVRENHEYLSFSQPLKFYEAIGTELPVITSPGSLVAELVDKWNVGWVVSSFEKLNFDDYRVKVENIRKIKGQHSWLARVQKVRRVVEKWNQTSH